MPKALCLSDLHAEEACLGYIRTLIEREKPDVVILTGDVTDNGPIDYAEDVLALCEKAKIPVVSVHGNNDPERVQQLLHDRTNYAHGRQAHALGYTFAGVGGSGPTPFGTVCEYDEKTMEDILDHHLAPDVIMVTHAPPYGVLDEAKPGVHIGSKAILDVVRRAQPRALVCGHVHDVEGTASVGKTVVVKVPSLRLGKAVVFDLSTLQASTVKV